MRRCIATTSWSTEAFVVPLRAMATVISPVADICRSAKRAARELARTDTAVKDAALEAIAAALEARVDEILEANERDMQAGEQAAIGEALLDRLRLDGARVAAIARAVRQIVALADPVGEVIEGGRLANGLDVRKVRVPLGVVAVVYEARPNVTIDAAALCLKSGNAIVLRGSSSATHSNAALAQIAGEAAVASGLPEGCVSLVAGGGRSELAELATQAGTVDLIIPRGGEQLEGGSSGRGHRARDLRGVGKLPRLRGCLGRSARCAGDRDQRQDPAARRVQRRRDAPHPCRRRAGVPTADPARARRRRRSRACRRTHACARAQRARRLAAGAQRHRSCSRPPARRTGRASTSRSRSP